MKKIFLESALVFVLFLGFGSLALASDVSLTIRDGANIVFSGSSQLPASGTVDITDSGGTTRTVNAQSVLGFLYVMDQADGSWQMSDLTYYNSFGSFYLKCLSYSLGEKCDNWQYVVDGTTPFSSIDQYILSGGEELYLYFGYPHRVSLNSSSVLVNQSFSAVAENYDYENDIWEPLTGVTLGVVQDNPSDPFNPTEISTNPVDANGVASFTIATVGSYKIGIKEDFYFPTFPLTVTDTPSSGGGGGGGGSSSGGGGGGGGSSSVLKNFDLKDAIEFLTEEQDEDGSFGGAYMYTDWAAIALGGLNDAIESKDKVRNYLLLQKDAGGLLTDNERRVMAILSLGEDPYDFGGVNYVEKILKDFDDVQFGEADLVNDDIFALISLYGSGFSQEDEVISKTISFVLKEQKTNGSWEGSVDLTASAVQALDVFKDFEGVEDSINLASKYLKSMQKEDGGWGSAYSTAWVLQAQEVLGVEWKKGGKNGENYLANLQMSDGGMLSKKDKSENRIWATSYAIPGVLGKPWTEIMQRVEKRDGKVAGIETEQTSENKDKILPTFAKKVVAQDIVTNDEEKISESISQVLGEENVAQVSESVEENLSSFRVITSFAFGLGLGIGLGIIIRRFRTV